MKNGLSLTWAVFTRSAHFSKKTNWLASANTLRYGWEPTWHACAGPGEWCCEIPSAGLDVTVRANCDKPSRFQPTKHIKKIHTCLSSKAAQYRPILNTSHSVHSHLVCKADVLATYQQKVRCPTIIICLISLITPLVDQRAEFEGLSVVVLRTCPSSYSCWSPAERIGLSLLPYVLTPPDTVTR